MCMWGSTVQVVLIICTSACWQSAMNCVSCVYCKHLVCAPGLLFGDIMRCLYLPCCRAFQLWGKWKGSRAAWPYINRNLRSFLNNPLNMPRRCTTWHAALWRRVGPMCLTTCVCHHDTSSDADWMEPSLCLQPWQPWLTSFIILHAGADSSIWLTVGREDWWGGWLTNDAVKTLSGHDLKVWCSLSDKQGIHKHMLVSL